MRPVETNLHIFIGGSLKHSQVGNLEHEAGRSLWRPDIQRLSWRRFQRATFQKLQNEQDIDIFLTRYSLVGTLQIYNAPKGPEILRRTHESKDDGTQRERI